MKISAVTRAQLKIPFGDTDRVVYCVVTSNAYSAAFCVGHAMFDYVGHRKFTVVDHYVKDAVLVAFEDPLDVLLVAGNDNRCGPEALMSVGRVSRSEQCIPDQDGYFQRNIIIAAGPKGEDDDNEYDEGDGGAVSKPDFSCSCGSFAAGFGGDGDDGGGAGASISAAWSLSTKVRPTASSCQQMMVMMDVVALETIVSILMMLSLSASSLVARSACLRFCVVKTQLLNLAFSTSCESCYDISTVLSMFLISASLFA